MGRRFVSSGIRMQFTVVTTYHAVVACDFGSEKCSLSVGRIGLRDFLCVIGILEPQNSIYTCISDMNHGACVLHYWLLLHTF
jgi:hypothetical protein